MPLSSPSKRCPLRLALSDRPLWASRSTAQPPWRTSCSQVQLPLAPRGPLAPPQALWDVPGRWPRPPGASPSCCPSPAARCRHSKRRRRSACQRSPNRQLLLAPSSLQASRRGLASRPRRWAWPRMRRMRRCLRRGPRHQSHRCRRPCALPLCRLARTAPLLTWHQLGFPSPAGLWRGGPGRHGRGSGCSAGGQGGPLRWVLALAMPPLLRSALSHAAKLARLIASHWCFAGEDKEGPALPPPKPALPRPPLHPGKPTAISAVEPQLQQPGGAAAPELKQVGAGMCAACEQRRAVARSVQRCPVKPHPPLTALCRRGSTTRGSVPRTAAARAPRPRPPRRSRQPLRWAQRWQQTRWSRGRPPAPPRSAPLQPPHTAPPPRLAAKQPSPLTPAATRRRRWRPRRRRPREGCVSRQRWSSWSCTGGLRSHRWGLCKADQAGAGGLLPCCPPQQG